jgi:hypothetical protein
MAKILTLPRRVYQRQDRFLDMLRQLRPGGHDAGQVGVITPRRFAVREGLFSLFRGMLRDMRRLPLAASL